MTRLSIRLLGPFQVRLDGEPATGFETAKGRALLAYLAAEADRPHRREVLAEMLWPGRPEGAARANLRHTLAQVRRAIGDRPTSRKRARSSEWHAPPPFLLASRETIRVNREAEAWVDLSAFANLAEVRTGPHSVNIQQLEDAMDLYRGPFLEDLSVRDSAAFEEWVVLKREWFGRQAANALLRLVERYQQLGEHERALQHAQHLVELEPWDEGAQRQMMRLLAHTGQRGAALAQYEACRRVLADQLDAEPGEETVALYRRIRVGAEILAPPLVPPHNLPAFLTPCVGRETELLHIRDCLLDPAFRVLTLVGPGGIGKTRLALEVAGGLISKALGDFTQGVYLVPLAPLSSSDAIAPTVAQTLGLRVVPGREPEEQLLGYLRKKRMLLILDNVEHLLASADLVVRMLRTAPGVKVVLTSRTRLNLKGEQLFPVAGLDYPPRSAQAVESIRSCAAVQLFLQAARRVHPHWEPTDEDLRAIGQICHLVQGMPLAILLAAPWVETMAVADIAGRVEESYRFLASEWRDVPERQRSMRAVFDHSWRLLTERERLVFRGMSVFRGGSSAEAAQQVLEATPPELRALADKSLLQRTSQGRYELHELLRHYATEKLSTTPAARQAVHDRHSAYYTAALQRWEAELRGPRHRAAITQVEADAENARAAWQWAVEQGHLERVNQAMAGLADACWWRGQYQEGETALQAAAHMLLPLETLDASQPAIREEEVSPIERLRLLAQALTWQSSFCRLLGRNDQAIALQRQSLAILDGPALAGHDTRRERAFLLWQMGRSALLADAARSRQLHQQSWTLYRELGDRHGMARALRAQGIATFLLGAVAKARALLEESLALHRAVGDRSGTLLTLVSLAETAIFQGRYDEGKRLAREGTTLSRELGSPSDVVNALLILGLALHALGRFHEARAQYEECLAIADDLGNRDLMAWAHAELSTTNLRLGHYQAACKHAHHCLHLMEDTGPIAHMGRALSTLGCVALAEGAYAEAHARLWESFGIYRRLGQQGQMGMGWCLANLSHAARGLRSLDQARQHLGQALRAADEDERPSPRIWAIVAAALLLADLATSSPKEAERAVELYALASRYPAVANSRWFEEIAGKQIAALAARLPEEVVAAARARGRARDLAATVADLRGEFEA